jgi:nucleoside-diphosphate-sugar epimerase
VRITVTGATGFIGGYLLERLVADGHVVTAMARRREAMPALKSLGVSVIGGTVADTDALAQSMVGSDVVIHLARAKAHGAKPTEVFEVNVRGTRAVARAAATAGVTRFVHASSSSVYGARAGLVKETSPLRPDSAYARSKAQAEKAVIEECGTRVVPVIARISSVMGARGRSWLPLFRAAGAGKLRLVGDGSNMHHPVDVSDVVEALMKCAFSAPAAGGTYNVAGPEPLTISGLRSAMAEAAMPGGARKKFPRSYPRLPLDLYYRAGSLADRMVGLRPPLFESVSFITANRVLDISHSRDELGFVPLVSVETAARHTADWFRAEGLLQAR